MNFFKAYEHELNPYEDDNVFLITYADLVTLLLVFFILLYALSVMESHKFKETINHMETLVKRQVNRNLKESSSPSFVIEEVTGLRPRNVKLMKALSRFQSREDQDKRISLLKRKGKIVLNISGESLFASGSAKMNPQAQPLFEKLSSIFIQFPEYKINIKGHTDNIPISTDQYPSNWELSAIRATTVLKYLIQKGMDPHMLTATGYGDSMPRFPNTSDINRAENRRVEFVLEKKESTF